MRHRALRKLEGWGGREGGREGRREGEGGGGREELAGRRRRTVRPHLFFYHLFRVGLVDGDDDVVVCVWFSFSAQGVRGEVRERCIWVHSWRAGEQASAVEKGAGMRLRPAVTVRATVHALGGNFLFLSQTFSLEVCFFLFSKRRARSVQGRARGRKAAGNRASRWDC